MPKAKAGTKAPKKSRAAAKKGPQIDQRYIAPGRIAEREAQGWKRVEQEVGGPQVVRRNGSVLMEKKG